ncbi:MAG TPA: acyl carrier protein [Dehalococcoidia bacterium]|nr:acyl carrier protein [Dehalococcoidia bacterium]
MSTLDELRKVIAKITHCDEQEINLDTALKDVKADSLNWVQIIIGVEMALDIEIDIDRLKELTTIEDFVNYMDSCIK